MSQPDIQQIMQQAQVMQQRMLALQSQLGEETVVGEAGDGLVKYTATCRKGPVGISIDPRVFELRDSTDLESFIISAIHDAERKADERLSQETERMMAELGLPANFALPT